MRYRPSRNGCRFTRASWNTRTWTLNRDLLGANSIIDDYPIMRHLCNLEAVKTYAGTEDIHTLVIGERVTGVAAYK